MTDRPDTSRWLRLLGGFIVSVGLAFSSQVLAQDDVDEDEAESDIEEVVVTGSRLKRDTYTSIAPLQVITGQISREVGLIDAADILQESTASSGQQIDLTFQGFVLDNGPGSSTISLRGLGEARTLVLLDGRRLAPAGVEGAPYAADLNLVPASLVQQYDLLLDGASSIYGSDAIAGVANIILRKDFDGFEIEGYTRVPKYSGGEDNTLSIVWGKNFDRGLIGIGVELVDTENVKVKDRPWTSGCTKHNEIDENGNIRTEEAFYNDIWGMEWDECRLDTVVSRVSVPFAGSIYYTPGISNGAWGNFSETNTFGFPIDTNGDGVADVSFRDYDVNGKVAQQNADLFADTSTKTFMAFGEYTFAGEANITPYFETLYAQREFDSDSSPSFLFPGVPALNPYNLCNPGAITGDGVDCGLGYDGLMNNPGVISDTLVAFGCDPSTGGSCDQTVGPIGAAGSTPITSVRGDRTFTDVEVDQLRVVGGVRGDLPFMNVGSLENWSFDIYASYSKSSGESHRVGVRDDRLDLALGWYSSTNTPCDNDLGVPVEADVAPGCVPINMFAPSLYPVGDNTTGDFATTAERAYLFDSRDFDTDYEQTIISAYITGQLFELPAGDVSMGFGVEHRNDDIDSVPDAVARDGLFFGFFSDGGATGDKDTDEVFAEIELPLLAGVPAFEELTLNLSGRYTDDEIYGSDNTYSTKLGWRPIESLLLRGTVGTSFRAPNLRELYLEAQSGFGNIFDPCFIPEDAIDPISGGYDAALDDRDANVLANCVDNGVDPTQANNNGFNTFSTEVATGGSLDLQAEESDSWSAGFAWDQPFTNAFNLSFGATYYEIDVTNTIIEPSGQFIVNDCYNSTTGTSAFCSRITRDLTDPTFPVIDIIDSGFINREEEKARGVDVNIAFDDTWTFFERPIDVGLDITANRQLERSTVFVDDDGNRDEEEFHGEWGFPDWSVQSILRFDYNDLRFTWETRYLSSVNQDPDGVDDFGSAFDTSDTCFGPPDDVLCRDYADWDSYTLHNASVYYYGDQWTFGGGIRNVFNEKPVFTDSDERLDFYLGVPLGYGYDLNGRVYFLNVAVNFGGGE